MGSNSPSASQDSHDDDDEEEYEESRRGNRLLGFMFGNVDNTGDLDADYLDEDAKEHLAALADKLGLSLTEMDLSVRSSRKAASAAEQDYDEKAEDAVDYEDIDEQYEGPEIQAATEEDSLLPEKEYVSAGVSFTNMQNSDSIFDDENYDEDEEPEKEPDIAVQDLETQSAEKEPDIAVLDLKTQSALSDVQAAQPEGELSHEQVGGSPVKGSSEGGFQEIEDTDEDLEETPEDMNLAPLPVLCVENGSVILKFSEIFGIQEATRRRHNRDRMYLVPRERLKFIDGPDTVEEDEESFLRGSVHGSREEDHTIQDDTLNSICYVNKSGKISHRQNDCIYSVKTDEDMLDDFLGAPMKEDITIDLSTLWKLPQSPNFYPFDQQDWEESILWDSDSLVPDSPGNVHEIVVPDNFEKAADLDFGEEDHQSPIDEPSVDLPIQNSPSAPVTPKLLLSNKIRHPQLLRLEEQTEVDNSSNFDGSEKQLQRHDDNDTTQQIKALPQNRHMLEESWLNNIIWGPDTAVTRPKIILDLQDTQMLFEVMDYKDKDKFWLHAGAMVITHSVDSSNHNLLELPCQGNQSDGRFDIANDVFYSNRKTNQQLNGSTEKRTGYDIEVYHSAPALKLETMKLKLSNKDKANFHRPKAVWFPHDNVAVFKEQHKLPTVGPMKIIVKSVGGKGSKLHVDTEETISSVKAKASKKLDFKLTESVKIFYRGKELEDLQTLSAQNVQPNSLLHVVRTNLHLLPKAQKIPSENKPLRPPGAFKKKSELSVKDGHVFLMEYCEERPLLLNNAGMGARLCTYYQKTAPSDQNGTSLSSGNKNLGSLLVLDTTDKSPFLGDIKPGGTQSSLETNMFRAPVFPHTVSLTDYLLIRSAKGKLSLRRIDKINVVGQQEPLIEVMSPASKELQPFLLKRVVVYMFRTFRSLKKRNLTPYILEKELTSQFDIKVPVLRRLKKHGFADLKRGPTGEWIWEMRPNMQIPSEQDLRKLVSPEKVCAYESMEAGCYRLKHLGITKLLSPAGLSNAMSRLPNEAIALAGASHIERELQITPWNLSSNFVACTNQVRENLERLEISGVGDPSGRGLGFSYVRATPKVPVSNALTKKKAAAAKVATTVTGTDADLRRLSMEAAREVLVKFNVPDEIITKLTRWHRIAMIRELSSEQAASGVKVDPTTIGKFARGQRMSFVQQQQQTRERCQEIWDRQVQSLIVGGDEGASDSESNSDLDSFAGDLENLLDAEEFEDDDDVVDQTTNERSEGAKAHKMRRHPYQVETDERVEDEEEEAAELRRMLMDDDENESLKKKKFGGLKKKIGSSQIKQLGSASENVERIKKPKKVVKHLSSSVLFDGASIPLENAHGDKDDAEMLLKKNIPPKMPKVKILGEVNLKGFKEKKSARESFVCGACGQLGHMRTNKHCPRYGEEISSLIEPNKSSAKNTQLDPSAPPHLKSAAKKSAPKKIAPPPSDATEADKPSASKPKPMKLKCLTSTESNLGPGSDPVPTSSIDKPSVKVSKIVISNKMKPDPPLESQNKPSIVIRPPTADPDRGFTEGPKPSIVIKPPVSTVEAYAKPSIVIRPPAEVEREQSHKRIVIKRPREVVDLEVHDGGGVDFDFRKTKKIVELSDIDSYGRQDSLNYSESCLIKRKKRDREHQRSWEEEEKRRSAEEWKRRRQMEEEQENLMELERFEDSLREEREEEMRMKAARKKKMKRPEQRIEYVDDFRTARRNDRRGALELTDQPPRRSRSGNESRSFVADLGPPTKRRRGGQVGLANILEHIVEVLRGRQEVSYLFLKPVTKKEAPDYLDIVDTPMDLSTIREKVRKLEYKSREEFRHDVWQIMYNAHLYNDKRNPGIPPLADQLLELCDYLIDENIHSLVEAEEGII